MKKSAIAFLLTLMMILTLSGCGNAPSDQAESGSGLKEIDKYFFETGTYTSLDHDFANDYFAENNDNWGGGCSAISKVIEGKRLVGRNMDLNISNKCAYFVKTDLPDKYRTFGLSYTFRDVSPDYDEVREKGLGETFEKVLPFMCDDVVNSEGLHIEINMRHGETDAQGNDVFGVEHTNPDASDRVYVFTLCQNIALNCGDLDEVEKYLAEEVDVYSKKGYWNYCFLITDAEGTSRLLEFGNNRYYWVEPDSDGVAAQTNFYVNEECGRLEDIKTGMGRYDTLMENIGNVSNKHDLYELMKKIQYSSYYLPYNECREEHFDPRSEVIGEEEILTYDLVMDPANENYIIELLDEINAPYRSMSRQEKQDLNQLWESTFTEVVDPAERTIEVRLFENEDYLYRISFDGIEKIDAI